MYAFPPRTDGNEERIWMKKLYLVFISTLMLNAELLKVVTTLPSDYKYTKADCDAFTEENLFILQVYINTGGDNKKFVIDHTETTKYVCKKSNSSQTVINTINKTLNKLYEATSGNEIKRIYETSCAVCHGTDIMGAPAVGDKNVWATVLKKGIDKVYANAIYGINGMPPKGGTTLEDANFKAVVDYMVSTSK